MAGRNYENYWGRQQKQKPFTQVNFRSILRNDIVAILQFSGSAYRSAHVMQTLIVSSRFLAILSHAKNLSLKTATSRRRIATKPSSFYYEF